MQFNPSELSDVIISESSSKSIQYNKFLEEGLFYNNNILKSESRGIIHQDGKEFSLNKYGFRSPDFKSNIDFLFSGCSITYGVGLSEEDLWHRLLVSELGGEYASVAFAGDSISGQVLKIFAYIKEFGKPKNIVCLFPNFDRFFMYNNKNLLASASFLRNYNPDKYEVMNSKYVSEIQSKEYLSNLFRTSADIYDTDGEIKYFKAPLVANQVITQEISHMYSAQFINMLSQYCEAAGIKFIWGTWDIPSNSIIKKVKNNSYFTEHVDLDLVDFERNFKDKTDLAPPLNCHKEYMNHPEFHFASDVSKGIEHAHYGLHRHLHFFEKFLKRIKEG
jgi:hypothetical protein